MNLKGILTAITFACAIVGAGVTITSVTVQPARSLAPMTEAVAQAEAQEARTPKVSESEKPHGIAPVGL